MKCFMLIGFPCSGKSTYAQQNYKGIRIISSDVYIDFIAQLRNSTYNEEFKSIISDANDFFEKEIKDAVSKKHDIVIDRTNLTKKSRKKLMEMLSSDYELIAIVFSADWKIILERNNGRVGKMIPLNVLDNMKKFYQEPIMEEGFSEILYYDYVEKLK